MNASNDKNLAPQAPNFGNYYCFILFGSKSLPAVNGLQVDDSYGNKLVPGTFIAIIDVMSL
jgi:hypothetical protein